MLIPQSTHRNRVTLPLYTHLDPALQSLLEVSINQIDLTNRISNLLGTFSIKSEYIWIID